MRQFITAAIVAAAAALGCPAQAEILIGVAGPMTGTNAWFGEQMQRGAELAIDDINAAGGLLGEEVRLLSADDFCDPDQAVAAAQTLVDQAVVFVVGHYCSGASIPASEVYEAAGVLQISPASTNPTLTEQGRANATELCDFHDGFSDPLSEIVLAVHLQLSRRHVQPVQKVILCHNTTIHAATRARPRR